MRYKIRMLKELRKWDIFPKNLKPCCFSLSAWLAEDQIQDHLTFSNFTEF